MRHPATPARPLLSVLLLFGAILLPAQAMAMKFGGVGRVGFDFGGDTLVTVYFSGGGSSDLNAGDGVYIAGGVTLMDDGGKFGGEATVGYKYTSIDASNQSFEFSRVPVDVIFFYNLDIGDKIRHGIRFGVGTTYHSNPKFSASGSLANGTFTFDDSLGIVGQIGYQFRSKSNQGVSVGLRLISIEYGAGAGLPSVNGSSAGIYVSGNF